MCYFGRESNISRIKKHDVVAKSNAKIEYKTVNIATCDLVCFNQLMIR